MNGLIIDKSSDCVDKVIEKLGYTIIMATPLGAGKPNHLINAFYKRALRDKKLKLTIVTALTLEKPKGSSFLEKRFLKPFTDRLFEDYPDLDYELDRVKEKIPDNIRVVEFYFPAGKFLKNSYAQRNYMSSNYTHCARDMADLGVNLIVQMVSEDCDNHTDKLSLSCNSDVTLDLIDLLTKNKSTHMFIGQINNHLPYMYGDAIVEPDQFDILIKNKEEEYKLFASPKSSIPFNDYMIGFYSSTLIKDGGELQIGIGNLGDTITHFLLLRQKDNEKYVEIFNKLEIEDKYFSVFSKIGEHQIFKKGLFAATEMLVDGFLELFEEHILKRKVYDNIFIQRLINEGKITESLDDNILDYLLHAKAIQHFLTSKNFDFLVEFGIFKENLSYKDNAIYLENGQKISADLGDEESYEYIKKQCLGKKLKKGAVIHGGFFLGPEYFYSKLKSMSQSDRRLIHMKSVTAINQLYGHEELDRLHRIDARFVNTCLMVTLSGAIVSDGLEDGNVVSGVGGQYNFVSMAHALPDGRSIIQLRSTRVKEDKVFSNIVWNYGHVTIPRHLRDIIVTEYGYANLRGKTDEEIIIELLKITDSRFQDELMVKAKKSGKLSLNYNIPDQYRNNCPEALKFTMKKFVEEGLFPDFPFGHSFTKTELRVGKALKWLKSKQKGNLEKMKLIYHAYMVTKEEIDSIPKELIDYMKLQKVHSIKEKLYKKIFILSILKT